MKKNLFSATTLGVLMAINANAQTYVVPTNSSTVSSTNYLGTNGTIAAPLKIATNGTPASEIQFFVGPVTTASNERMRIASNGNVGIGTGATVNEKLEVNGNIKVTNSGTAPTTGSFTLGKNASSKMGLFASNADVNLLTSTANNITLGNTNSPKLKLNSSGVVSIGSENINSAATSQFHSLVLKNNTPTPGDATNRVTGTLMRIENSQTTDNMTMGVVNCDGCLIMGAAQGDAGIVTANNKKLMFSNWSTMQDPTGIAYEFSTMYFSSKRTLMNLDRSGKVVIGNNISSNYPGNALLYVEKGILTEGLKIAKVGSTDWAWPDYVFSKNHKLHSLDSVEAFINKNSHLPNVPSAEEVGKNGIDVAKMDATLLQKIEEMTLYLIEINKKLGKVEEENKALKNEIEILKKY